MEFKRNILDRIVLENLSKRFQNEWVFKNISYEFNINNSYAILGLNGSGKSTLLQCISGLLTPSKGSISYFSNEKIIGVDEVFEYISISGPYLELIEEFTLLQMIDFHKKFKNLRSEISNTEIIDILNLNGNGNKVLRTFSSGMKQRVKLALAILTDSDLLLLDEPTSNLDAENRKWFRELLNQNNKDRILVVCSNHIKEEYEICNYAIEMSKYK